VSRSQPGCRLWQRTTCDQLGREDVVLVQLCVVATLCNAPTSRCEEVAATLERCRSDRTSSVTRS
jgi:hypothetical protein